MTIFDAGEPLGLEIQTTWTNLPVGTSGQKSIKFEMITNLQLSEFLKKLAADVAGKNGVLLPDWESGFLASFMEAGARVTWFTEGRRQATERMWQRFGPEINHPHPSDTVTERPRMDDADPTGCEYLVKDEGRQRRCNEPAICQEFGRLRYCQMHGDAAVLAMKRSGKTLRLIRFP